MTQRFLQRRQKLRESGAPKVKKEVDRRASKHRKIRYVVHEKLVNFMTPLDNLGLLGGDSKDNIVLTLFGQKPVEEKVLGKRARPNDIEEGIRLI